MGTQGVGDYGVGRADRGPSGRLPRGSGLNRGSGKFRVDVSKLRMPGSGPLPPAGGSGGGLGGSADVSGGDSGEWGNGVGEEKPPGS